MEAVPLYGSPVSLIWPFGGLSIGALANLCFKASFSPEQQRHYKRKLFRLGAPLALAAGAGVFLLNLRVTPETGRLRCEAKWPWLNEETVADLEPIFENFLETKVLTVTNGKVVEDKVDPGG